MKFKSFKIATLGCKVNQYESFSIIDSLANLNIKETKFNSDLVIVNTCAVTHVACHQSRQAISKSIRENPSATVIITGCYVDLYPEEIRERFSNVILIPTPYKLRIWELAQKGEFDHLNLSPLYFPGRVPNFRGRARAYLKIQDGCEQKCSYCIVPIARGGYKSLDLHSAVSQARELEERGLEEMILTGIHLGMYGAEKKGLNLEKLLIELISNTSILKFRLSSIEPTEISPNLISLIKESNRICRHLHIPLQSGSKEILSKMNRNYSPKFFRDLIFYIKEQIPDCGLGTDIIVGFPGESEEEFNDTVSLIEELPLSYLHVFPYSPRKGTPAYNLVPQFTSKEAKLRVNYLRRLGEMKRRTFMEQMLGANLEFVPEKVSDCGQLVGHTDNYLPGILSDGQKDLVRRRVLVKVIGIEENRLSLKEV